MFVAGNLIIGLAKVVGMALELYFWVVVVRALMSWIRPDPYNPIVRFICSLVDPVTYRISRIIPTRIGMVDIAPLIMIAIIYFLKEFLVRSLVDIGISLR